MIFSARLVYNYIDTNLLYRSEHKLPFCIHADVYGYMSTSLMGMCVHRLWLAMYIVYG